jgi:hypothetical protein
MPKQTFHNQRGSSNFLFIAIFAIILSLAAVIFLYLEFESIDKSGVQIAPDIKQLSEQEKKALLEKLNK